MKCIWVSVDVVHAVLAQTLHVWLIYCVQLHSHSRNPPLEIKCIKRILTQFFKHTIILKTCIPLSSLIHRHAQALLSYVHNRIDRKRSETDQFLETSRNSFM